MRPDISYYNKAGEEVEDMDVENDGEDENENEKSIALINFTHNNDCHL